MAKKIATKKPVAEKSAGKRTKAPKRDLRVLLLVKLQAASDHLAKLQEPRYRFAAVARDQDPGLDFNALATGVQGDLAQLAAVIEGAPADWKPAYSSKRKPLTPEQVAKLKERAAAINAQLEAIEAAE